MWAIQTIVLSRSNKEVISNACSSICFIKLEILCILGILGLSLVYACLETFLLAINLDVVSSSNIFNSDFYVHM